MKSGGEISFNPNSARDLNNDSRIDKNELEKGLSGTPAEIAALKNNPSALITLPSGLKLTWQQLQAYVDSSVQKGQNLTQAANFSAELGAEAQRNSLLGKGSETASEIDLMKNALSRGTYPVNLSGRVFSNKSELQTAIDQRVRDLGQTIAQIRRANVGLGRSENADIPSRLLTQAGISSGENGNGNGTSTFQARSMSLPASQQGPSGGQGAQNGQGGQGARAMGLPGTGGGYGFPFGGGMEPPTSAAYASALYMDGSISEGLGMIGRSQREGQKLMLLFFYYARMAESGDIGAMYQLIKFVNYIIAKDKARQNIQITSKLIQLQDLSRKSTEALMSVATDDPEKQADFTKALHKAKSEEQTIATSQKLLADMLQEFAQVVESLTNSTKFLLEAEGRIMRTVTRP